MVVKSELKLIKSLQQKKYRNEHGLFVIEGKKAVEELLESSFKPFKVFVSKIHEPVLHYKNVIPVSAKELQQMSGLKNPNGFLGVFYIPESLPIEETDWVLVSDGIQDPGNMGTIIRLCDWFGIKNLVCSNHTVDCYNPKVLQATMGSITRVNIVYTDLDDFLKTTQLPIYASIMDGENIYKINLPDKGILVMGNEGNGISANVKEFCTKTMAIPQYDETTTESLNVATASAILLNEIRRN